jgi:hypothetical protein
LSIKPSNAVNKQERRSENLAVLSLSIGNAGCVEARPVSVTAIRTNSAASAKESERETQSPIVTTAGKDDRTAMPFLFHRRPGSMVP